MTKLLFNLIEVQPFELSESNLCIWCDMPNKKNDAHILSRQLLRTNCKANILKKSVCEKCNSLFGQQIEDWFFKYSPIGTWKQQFYQPEVNFQKNMKYLPNFIWMEDISEWVVLNYKNVDEIIGTQIIHKSDDTLLVMHLSDSEEKGIMLLPSIEETLAIEVGDYTEYKKKELPENFSARVFLYNSKIILISKTKEDALKIREKIKKSSFGSSNKECISVVNRFDFRERLVHYKWSYSKYLKWASKISFEFLALIESPNFAASSIFKSFKSNMIDPQSYKNDDEHVIPFLSGKGYQIGRFSPNGWVSMFFNAKKYDIELPIFNTENQNCHKIFIYELNGLLLCTVKLFNIEVCQIILAENADLKPIYYIEYDFINDKLKFYYTNKGVFNKRMTKKSFEDFSEVYNEQTMTRGTVILNESMQKLFI